MNNYLVVADDFTGANDTGLQIRRRGIAVDVLFSAAGAVKGASLVIDTESRFLPERDAYKKILSEGEKIFFGNFSRVIKKVDSTLRGNIAAETRALDECFAPELIVFAPAYPDLGRTTVNRIHHINGKPISQTELAKDLKTPVKTDDVYEIMASAFDETVIHVNLDDLNSGNVDLNRARIFTFDAEINEDIFKIIQLVQSAAKRVLWVGCAGLADILLSVDLPLPPVLAVLASLSSVTRSQVHYAEGQGIPLVKVPLYAILEGKSTPLDIAGEAVSLLKKGKDLILLSSSVYSMEEYNKTEEAARRQGKSPEETSIFTQDLMGQITLDILESLSLSGHGISGLFLSGGDTAISCFKKAGAYGSSIISEISPGIPLVKLAGGKCDGLKAATKAGAFGSEDAVYYAMRRLREA